MGYLIFFLYIPFIIVTLTTLEDNVMVEQTGRVTHYADTSTDAVETTNWKRLDITATGRWPNLIAISFVFDDTFSFLYKLSTCLSTTF